MKRRFRTLLQSMRHRSQGSSDTSPEVVLTPVEARQGFLGKPVLIVLALSMILAVGSIAFLMMVTP